MFNIANKPDYALQSKMIEEMIRLYGTEVVFAPQEKIRKIGPFPEFASLKSSKDLKERCIHVLMADTEGFPSGLQLAFNNFGVINDDTLQVFVSLNDLAFLSYRSDKIVNASDVQSNLIVFPNGKVMEITNFQYHVPGVSNAFVYSNQPSCYQLSLKSYNFDASADDEIHVQNGAVGIQNNTVDEFFAAQKLKMQEIKEFAERESLTTENFKDKIRNNKVNDIFAND